MKIVTGRTGTPHITSDDDRANNAGTYGKNYYVLNINDCLSHEIISSNEIKINSGELIIQGTHARIEYGTSESVAIDDGQSGYKRIDLIVARYQKMSGMESVVLKVIKGTPATANPTTPERNKENLLRGGSICDMPLYKVYIDGVNITEVEPRFIIVPSLSELQTNTNASIESLTTSVNTLTTDLSALQTSHIELSERVDSNYSSTEDTITEINSNISGLRSKDATFESEISDLQTLYTQLANRVDALEKAVRG